MKTVQEDPIETYRLLTCAICTTHDCCFHGQLISYILLIADLDRCEIIPEVVDDSTPWPENEPCGEDCYFTQVVLLTLTLLTKMRDGDPTTDEAGVWTEEEIALLEACVRIQGKSDRTSCLAAVGLGKPCTKVNCSFNSN